jgi:Zn-dependent protease with chaperone function
MLRNCLLLTVVVAYAGCAVIPDGAYFPSASKPEAVKVSGALYRAAQSAGDDPRRYSFALINTMNVAAYTADDATFYFSEGLARQPARIVDALVAHEVAHEVLGHAGQRLALDLSLSAGFSILGIVVPGLSLMNFVANPLIVRAFSRDQEISADLKAVEILRSMGYESPRRTVADALRAAVAVNGAPSRGLFAHEPSLEDRLAAIDPLEPDIAAKALTR